MDPEILDWLMQGDPSIRWQVMRDLLKSPKKEYLIEQDRIFKEGWGNQLLSHQDEKGMWGGGLYSPKWVSTTYTLLLLSRLGLPDRHPAAVKGCLVLLNAGFYKDGGINLFAPRWAYSETCVTGIVLAILSWFSIQDKRLESIAGHLLDQQMPDGGWNCRKPRGAKHSSFHTTINVLEGLAEYCIKHNALKDEVSSAIGKAIEFLLQHQLYKSHTTGRVFDSKMTLFSFPPRWRYDVMRILDFLGQSDYAYDQRMDDAIELLRKKKRKNGRWNLQNKHPGRSYFDMETAGEPSRWNTLRALRILMWMDRAGGLSSGS